MKTSSRIQKIIAAIFFIATLSLSAQTSPREFSKKTVELKFPTNAAASNWKYSQMDFSSWIFSIKTNGWILLHKSKTKEFYFAVFRSGDHLIFCKNDRRKIQNTRSSFSVHATDPTIGYAVRILPSKWAALEFVVKSPYGESRHSHPHSVAQIKSGFSGPLEVTFSVARSEDEYRTVFDQKIFWNPSKN